MGAAEGFELSALAQQAHLLNGDLAQGSVGRKGDEIGVGGEQQGVVGALVGGPFLALVDEVEVLRQAEVVLFDFVGVAEERGGKAPGEGCFADAFGSAEQDGLGKPAALDHVGQGCGGGGVAVEIREGQILFCATAGHTSDHTRAATWEGSPEPSTMRKRCGSWAAISR